MYATVSDRDPKQLQKGLVKIQFTEESRLRLAGFQVGEAQFALKLVHAATLRGLNQASSQTCIMQYLQS